MALGADARVVAVGLELLAREFLDRDELVEAALVDYFVALASAAPRALCAAGGADIVLLKLRTQHPPLETVARLLRCVLHLAADKTNHDQLLAAGAPQGGSRDMMLRAPGPRGRQVLPRAGASAIVE